MENVKSVRASVKERVAAAAADAPFSGKGGVTNRELPRLGRLEKYDANCREISQISIFLWLRTDKSCCFIISFRHLCQYILEELKSSRVSIHFQLTFKITRMAHTLISM